MDLVIADGRKYFWRWDTEQYLLVDGLPVEGELHFDMPDTDIPVKVLLEERDGQLVCKVPDELLQHDGKFTVWMYLADEDGNRTMKKKVFKVADREKPSDYVYTETEHKTWSDLNNRIGAVEDTLNNLVNYEEAEF